MTEQDKTKIFRRLDIIAEELRSIYKKYRSNHKLESFSEEDLSFINHLYEAYNRLRKCVKNKDLSLDKNDPEDRQKLIEMLMESDKDSALSLMKIDDSFYLGWSHGNFIKIGEDSFTSQRGVFNKKEAIKYLESV